MNTDTFLLPLGIILLCVPAAVLSPARVRERMRQPARRREGGLGSLLRCAVNWIDLLRGAGGAWLVQHVFQGARAGQDELAITVLVVQAAILLAAFAAQTIWIGWPLRIIGPAFFYCGVTLVVSGPLVGGFALILGFSCALLMRRLSAGFILAAAGIVGFGVLFHRLGGLVVANAALFSMPALLSVICGSRIAFARNPAGGPRMVSAGLRPGEKPATAG